MTLPERNRIIDLWSRKEELEKMLKYNNGISEDMHLKEELTNVRMELDTMMEPYMGLIDYTGQKPHMGYISSCSQKG